MMKKWLSILLILFLMVGVAYAGDVKKEDKEVLKDSVVVDKTKESFKEIGKGIQVRDTSADIAKYDVKTEKNKITISKTDTVKNNKVEHTKTKLVIDEKTAKSIDVDKDGKFGYLRKVDGQVVEVRVVTLKELTTGIDATFSEVIINGFTGYYTVTKTNQRVSTGTTLGQSYDSDKVQSIILNISADTTVDPYTEMSSIPKTIWYRFDEGTRTHVYNWAGNGLNGTRYNGNNWTTGKHNGAAYTHGGTEYISSFNPTTTIGTNTNFTISMWTKTTADDKNLFATSSIPRFYIRTLLTGSLRVGYNDTITEFPNATINPNQWTHIMWLVDVHNNIMYIYINNVLKGSYAYTNDGLPNEICRISGYTGKIQTIDDFVLLRYLANESVRNTLYYDGLQQLQASTDSNTTYSPMWNSSSDNPLTIPISSFDGLISSIQFKVPQNVTQNGVTIYNYNETVAPFTPTVTVLFTEDITEITDTHTTLVQTVNITHTSANTADNGSIIPYEILDGYNGPAVLSSNNTNASISRNATHFTISTGYLAAGSTYYYNVEIPVVRASFVNPSATVVVVITAAGAFVGGSFINQWYRRRRGS